MAELGALQKLAADGTEVPFSADITVALELEQVVVSDLRAQAVAGTADLVGYELCLVESPPLPPPAEVSGFGGLDDFGLGDLGFDADIMGDLADLADDVAGAVDAVMEAADQLAALAALGSIDVGGPLQPLCRRRLQRRRGVDRVRPDLRLPGACRYDSDRWSRSALRGPELRRVSLVRW